MHITVAITVGIGSSSVQNGLEIFSSWLRFFLRNPIATNKTSVPLTKNNNKILFYIKKIK